MSEGTSLRRAPSRLQLAILGALQPKVSHFVGLRPVYQPRPKHIYGGTVPGAEVARRRAANKVARRSRRANRLRAS